MKRLVLPLLIALIACSCFAQSFPKKQTLIPLSNVDGVPFYIDQDMNDWAIDGFEIDQKGNFYFFGGRGHGCLASFNGAKQVFRKNFIDLSQGGGLYLYKNYLYSFTFDKTGKPVYIKINANIGSFAKMPGPAKNIGAATDFIDSCMIFEFSDPVPSKAHYDQYSLSGKFLKTSSKLTDIRPIFYPDTSQNYSWSFAGPWNENYVFWGRNGLNAPDQLCLVDKTGKILAKRTIPNGLTGKGYFEEPDEDRKVRNGSFFVLGRKGNYALITEIPLASFFGK